jgi:hypothetical protein
MQQRTKEKLLMICLFLFLFVVLGGGLHLSPSGAFLATVTGAPLIVYVFNVWRRRCSEGTPSSHQIMTLHARDASSAETANLIRH